jgi:hypothetical protein
MATEAKGEGANMIECQNVKERIQKFLRDGVTTYPTKDKTGCVIQIPFHDSEGDPIRVAVYESNGAILLSDGGIVAGHLFTLGQHTQDTPAFKLLRSLEKAYDLHLDFDYGRIAVTVPDNDLCKAILDFSKIIMTMLTSTPHIRVEPHRLKPLGQRLKVKVRKQFGEDNILDLVEPEYLLPGVTIENWPIDFHWWVKRNGGLEEHTYIVTVDLDVSEAIAKAERVTTLALDARRSSDDKIRVVVDSHGIESDATVATKLMKAYSNRLNYTVYDFGQENEWRSFINQSVNEVKGEYGKPWREYWLRQQGLTPPREMPPDYSSNL